MGRATFDHADFLRAARELATEYGPAAVTVGSVTERLNAPNGSFYHRFASRDDLLGQLWLENIRAFQEGFVAEIDAGNGLAAALHIAAWARAHPDEARLLLLYNREDFVKGEWPSALKQGVEAQTRRIEACLKRFARDRFGNTTSNALRRAAFALIEVPIAAVRPHLRRRETLPPLVDELIRETYAAIVVPSSAGKKSASVKRRLDSR